MKYNSLEYIEKMIKQITGKNTEVTMEEKFSNLVIVFKNPLNKARRQFTIINYFVDSYKVNNTDFRSIVLKKANKKFFSF